MIHLTRAEPFFSPGVERDRPRCQLRSPPPPPPLCVMSVITLAAPACLLWMALVIYRGEPRAIGHPSFASALAAVRAPLYLCLALVFVGGCPKDSRKKWWGGGGLRMLQIGGVHKSPGSERARRVYLHKAAIEKNKQTKKYIGQFCPLHLKNKRLWRDGRTKAALHFSSGWICLMSSHFFWRESARGRAKWNRL